MLLIRWGSPWYTALIVLIVVLVFILVIYYNDYDSFTSSTALGPASGSFFGNYHGAWLYVSALLGIVGSSCCVGFTYAKNTDAALWSFAISVLLVLLFYLSLQSLIDLAKISFYLWFVVAALAQIIIAIFGYLMYSRGIKTDDQSR